ncbi:MAG TPA: sulfoxide reductase heme-binding subunit YedZ [Oxalobacteraceae bacterium]|nr:sulfoxide reductase heme-binding subunit YedZ [Oxalobacteraceae bacterium]
MFQPAPRQLQVIKIIVFLAALLPLARLVWFGFTDRLGANPIEFITRSTGDWTLYFLCLTLAVTPLRRLLQWPWLIRLRRMLGLFCFFYAVMHFTTFLWFDHFFDLGEMWRDVLKRPFIAVGFTTFVLLIPLAITSSNAMVRRLGGKHWQQLHRLIYLIAPLGILHFWWMKAGKNDFAEPIVFGVIVAILLGMRLYWRFMQNGARPLRATPR